MVMTVRGNRDDGRVTVRRAALFGVLWAVVIITFDLLFTERRAWVVILSWSLTAVPVAALWWWLVNRPLAVGRRTSRRP